VTVFRLSPRDRRTLTLGAVIAIPILLWRFAWMPYGQAIDRAREELDQVRDRYAREMELVNAAPRYPAIRARLESAHEATAGRLFSGPDDLTAASRLTASVGELLRDLGMAVGQLEGTMPEPLDGGLVALGVTVRTETDLEGVLAFLEASESGPELVRIDALTVERTAGVAAGESSLTMTARLTGFARAGGDRKSAAEDGEER
jgi:hypothetical protein